MTPSLLQTLSELINNRGGHAGCTHCSCINTEFLVNIRTALTDLQAENERYRELLQLVLPLAKGYAAEHPVGSNQEYVEQASLALEEKG